MNISQVNTSLLFYIGIMVFAISAYILVYTGKIEKKRTNR